MKRALAALAAVLVFFGATAGSLTVAAEEVSETVMQLNEDDQLTYPFTAEADGRYAIRVEYRVLPGRSITPRLAITIDEPYQKMESSVYEFPRVWEDVREGERFKQDGYGNELSPIPQEKTEWQTMTLCPAEGSENAGFELKAGDHTLYLQMLQENMEIRSLSIQPITSRISYKDYLASLTASGYATETKRQEAELLSKKSHLEVAVTYDHSSPSISPNDPNLIRYNVLGGSSWSRAGQWVSYTVDVPADGLYALDIQYRQRTVSGVDVRRRIYIDGEVPFKELECVLFPASRNFKTFTPGENGEPYQIYLTKGPHEIRFEVVLGSLQGIIADFQKVIDDLNVLSSKINVIVGEGVDLNRDYNFVESIPGIGDTLKNAADRLEAIVASISEGNDESGSQSAQLREVARLLREMGERPNDMASQIDYFRSKLYEMAGILSTMKTQPIEMDYFDLRPVENEVAGTGTHWWETIAFRAKAFFGSFIRDYASMTTVDGKEALNVWISLGRDQAQIMNQLITDDFTPATGIPVNLSLVTTNIMTAIASGKAPDVVLNMGVTNVADLYYRDALVDLSQMPDAKEVFARYYPSSLESIRYGDAIYAVPQTQSFQMMFYRKDVFEELGIDPPNTWTDLYAMLNLLQNEGMQVGIPVSQEILLVFMHQRNKDLFNDNMTATTLTDAEMVSAFTQWTELFTKYGIPKSYDSVNRFRTGQMPLVIADYTFYKTLTISAPEIKNSFAMAPLPATVNEDGTLNRAQDSGVSGAVIIRKDGVTDYTPEMKFVSWATSDSVQERYAFNSEIRVGISARVQTANINVMSKISWTRDELEALNAQWSEVRQIRQSPAQYYVTRNISNAFRKVVYQYENPRDVIYRYSQEINDELVRKREELGLEG